MEFWRLNTTRNIYASVRVLKGKSYGICACMFFYVSVYIFYAYYIVLFYFLWWLELAR